MKIITPLGDIHISFNVIKSLIYQALIESYGLVRMDDVNIITKYLGGDDKGIRVREEEDGLSIDVFPVVSYGMKIDQIAFNAQENISYKLLEMLGVEPKEVNVHFLGIKID